ncbi:putative integral membrane protein [Frankia sp. EI5c]|uniref:anthrone oxygenase family protein n=1 Tax=Frankia sp. EI5c TaxID=683316 RepID=UPI0007C323D5|nr:anthrone oxygenase family protein [Frankia sp. EI5c]OAA25481.1 putative integral membrane protein [Frankia sp. EI5c]
MQPLRNGSLIAATVGVGLMAGIYFAFACSVMPGLRATDDRTFVAAMRSINTAILNGWFFLAFLGALALTGLAGAVQLGSGQRPALPWIVAAFVLYGLTILTTGAVNVPLNEGLAAAGEPGRAADLAAARDRFEATWVRWNLIRTAACVAAFGCLTWALLLQARGRG